MNTTRIYGRAISLLGLALLSACSFGPSAVGPPSISASGAAKLAIETYDTDGDGTIAGKELDKAPAIKAAISNLDSDGDGKVTAEAIEERIEAWQDSGTGLMSIRCMVTIDDKPLKGATVTFDPEPFLGDAVKQGVGQTDTHGTASMTIPKDQRATPTTPPGVQFALYRVRISKMEGGKEVIPARYNTETVLGQEISYDDAGVKGRIVYQLKSK